MEREIMDTETQRNPARLCNEVMLLLSAYVDGETSRSEKTVVERHLDGCKSCREARARLASTISAVATLPQIQPDERFLADLKTRLVQSETLTERVSRWLDDHVGALGSGISVPRMSVALAAVMSFVICKDFIISPRELAQPQAGAAVSAPTRKADARGPGVVAPAPSEVSSVVAGKDSSTLPAAPAAPMVARAELDQAPRAPLASAPEGRAMGAVQAAPPPAPAVAQVLAEMKKSQVAASEPVDQAREAALTLATVSAIASPAAGRAAPARAAVASKAEATINERAQRGPDLAAMAERGAAGASSYEPRADEAADVALPELESSADHRQLRADAFTEGARAPSTRRRSGNRLERVVTKESSLRPSFDKSNMARLGHQETAADDSGGVAPLEVQASPSVTAPALTVAELSGRWPKSRMVLPHDSPTAAPATAAEISVFVEDARRFQDDLTVMLRQFQGLTVSAVVITDSPGLELLLVQSPAQGFNRTLSRLKETLNALPSVRGLVVASEGTGTPPMLRLQIPTRVPVQLR